MAGKTPADQFYFGDWERDLGEHPLEIGGAWMLILGKTWFTAGHAEKTISQWSNVLRVREEKTLDILRYIKEHKIGDVSDLPADVTNGHFKVTVISRRQKRLWDARKNARLRKAKSRASQAGHNDVTDPSSLSSQSSQSLDLSFYKNTAWKCYSQCGGGCASQWSEYRDRILHACHHCQKFDRFRKEDEDG